MSRGRAREIRTAGEKNKKCAREKSVRACNSRLKKKKKKRVIAAPLFPSFPIVLLANNARSPRPSACHTVNSNHGGRNKALFVLAAASPIFLNCRQWGKNLPNLRPYLNDLQFFLQLVARLGKERSKFGALTHIRKEDCIFVDGELRPRRMDGAAA